MKKRVNGLAAVRPRHSRLAKRKDSETAKSDEAKVRKVNGQSASKRSNKKQRAAKRWAAEKLECLGKSGVRQRWTKPLRKKGHNNKKLNIHVLETIVQASCLSKETKKISTGKSLPCETSLFNCISSLQSNSSTKEFLDEKLCSRKSSCEKPLPQPGVLRTYFSVYEKKSGKLGFYDIANRTWHPCTIMESCESSCSCLVTLDEELYLLDGSNLFLFEKTSWKQLDSLNFCPGCDARAVVFQHFIFVVDDSKMAWYDSILDMWEYSDHAPFGSGFCLTVLAGFIYIIGWSDTHKRVTRYDPLKTESQEITSTMLPRMWASAVAFYGMIFVMGGTDGMATDQVERFDPKANMWTFIAPMSVPRMKHAAHVLGDKIYVLGGRTKGGTDVIEVCEKIGGVYRWRTLNSVRQIEIPFSATIISTVLA